MKNLFKRLISIMCIAVLVMTEMPAEVYACTYDPGSDTLYCSREQGCFDDELLTAKKVVVDTFITRTGIDKLKKNENLESLYIRDMSNLTEEDLNYFYPYLAKGNVALAAVLFSYGDYYSSFGNDGTTLYRRVMKEKCSQVVTLRSCASVVSAALNAAGVIHNYGSAAVAGLVDYFNGSEEWVNLGPATEEELREGDVIFIDRRSHASEYQTGTMEDAEYTAEEEYVYEYNGGYDATGHKNYETEDPTGSSYEVFSPDQDGDGEIGEWEAEYWKCYWERVNEDGYVPPYDYYYVWEEDAKAKEEAEKQKKKAEEEERRRAEEAQRAKVVKKRPANRVIHDHIFVWTGNEIITRYFPDSSGNIVSGSYTENYSNARSAAISKYNFTGDYYVYRYVGPLSTVVSADEMVSWKANTAAIVESLRANSKDKVANALNEIDNEEFERAAAEARARQLEEERKALRKKRMTQKLDLIRKNSICSYITSSIESLSGKRNYETGRLTGVGMSEDNKKLYSGNINND